MKLYDENNEMHSVNEPEQNSSENRTDNNQVQNTAANDVQPTAEPARKSDDANESARNQAPADQAPAAAGQVAVVTHVAQIFMPLAELVDLEKEKARMEKELKKNSAELEKLNAKLANPGFVNKAPANVVAAERERAEKLEALIAKLEEQLAGM